MTKTFVEFLTEGGLGSGRKRTVGRPRPKRTLWFENEEYWLRDLAKEHPECCLMTDKEENKVYAIDKDNNLCYGIWLLNKRRGVTFHIGRPVTHVCGTTKLKEISNE